MMAAATEKEARYRELRKQQAMTSPPSKITPREQTASPQEEAPLGSLRSRRRRNLADRRYRRLRTIGSGSFGAVYSADDTMTGVCASREQTTIVTCNYADYIFLFYYVIV